MALALPKLSGSAFHWQPVWQHINYGRKDLPRRDRLAPATRLPVIASPLATFAWIVPRQQRFGLGPEFVGNLP